MDGILEARGRQLFNAKSKIWEPKDLNSPARRERNTSARRYGHRQRDRSLRQQLTYGANGYLHSANLGLTLSSDAQGCLTPVTAPTG
jgi:hypothetical protein